MRKVWVTGLAALALLAACEQEDILEGERLALRADLSSDAPAPARADDTDAARPIALPPASTSASWTHRAATPTNEIGHRALSAQPRLAWSASIGQGNDRRHRIVAEP